MALTKEKLNEMLRGGSVRVGMFGLTEPVARQLKEVIEAALGRPVEISSVPGRVDISGFPVGMERAVKGWRAQLIEANLRGERAAKAQRDLLVELQK